MTALCAKFMERKNEFEMISSISLESFHFFSFVPLA